MAGQYTQAREQLQLDSDSLPDKAREQHSKHPRRCTEGTLKMATVPTDMPRSLQ